MNASEKGLKRKKPTLATELIPDADPSKAFQEGRRLKLFFEGPTKPELDRIEFHANNLQKGKCGFLQRGFDDKDYSFRWSAMPKALSLCFLDYLNAGRAGKSFSFHGNSQTDTLADAVVKTNGKLFVLFVEFLSDGGISKRVEMIFARQNLNRTEDRDRSVSINSDYLPHDCVEVCWGRKPIPPEKLERFTELFRKVWKLPPPSVMDLPVGEARRPEVPDAKKTDQETAPAKPPPLPNSPTQPDLPKAAPAQTARAEPPVIIFEPKGSTPSVTEPSQKTKQAEPQPKTEPETKELTPTPVSERFPDIDHHRDAILTCLEGGTTAFEIRAILGMKLGLVTELQRVTDYIEDLLRELFPPGRISPKLFAIREPERTWENEQPLIAIGPDPKRDMWTIGDACQGTLILGAPGSGKTTGSGHAIASHFLSQGFGGIILTTKQSEVCDWVKRAGMFSRQADVAVVCPEGFLRLNMLQYEMERPGLGVKLSENLVRFFKNIASVIGQRSDSRMNEAFWENSGNELLQNTIDCFLLAKHPVTLNSLCAFITNAPTDEKSAEDGKWQNLPVFGECMTQAAAAVKTDADRDEYNILREYWLKAYPNLAPNTRSCITTAFTAMVRSLRSRHISDLLSTMTTITPESTFSGRIIIVDLPINEFHEGGLLVQAAWKYLFMRAVLNRADRLKGSHCRPVFLWEDECQSFMIDFDADFQPVSREYRVACVKLSQNISNFYARFGGGDAARTKVHAIIGSLNSRLLHANGDSTTNEWASKSIGTGYKTLINTATTPARYTGFNPFGQLVHKLFSRPTVTTSENTVREPVIHPHEFATLQTGKPENGFVTSAVVSQVGRTLSTGKNFEFVGYQQVKLPLTDAEKLYAEGIWRT